MPLKISNLTNIGMPLYPRLSLAFASQLQTRPDSQAAHDLVDEKNQGNAAALHRLVWRGITVWECSDSQKRAPRWSFEFLR